MASFVKPPRLAAGGRVATVSTSWGGPAVFPHWYQIGKSQFERAFNLRVVESAHALRDPQWLAANPRARADDLMAAFADPSIDGIVSTIGGDDSVRLLPLLDPDVIRRNPKVVKGYSDFTVTNFACLAAGLVSFSGPSFMAGFGENGGIFPYTAESVRRTLFHAAPRRPARTVLGRLDGRTSGLGRPGEPVPPPPADAESRVAVAPGPRRDLGPPDRRVRRGSRTTQGDAVVARRRRLGRRDLVRRDVRGGAAARHAQTVAAELRQPRHP